MNKVLDTIVIGGGRRVLLPDIIYGSRDLNF